MLEKRELRYLGFIKYMILLFIGGIIYYGIEILWRGHSHPAMILVGGLCFILIGLINQIFGWNIYLELQMLIGDVCVLVVEFIAGYILNLYLGLDIWDYSELPLNLLGQICIPFAILWLPLTFVAIVLDDWIKWFFMGERRPIYKVYILQLMNKNPIWRPFKMKTIDATSYSSNTSI